MGFLEAESGITETATSAPFRYAKNKSTNDVFTGGTETIAAGDLNGKPT